MSTTRMSSPSSVVGSRPPSLAVERVDRQAGLLVCGRSATFASSRPLMPCSGLNRATSLTSFALKIRSIVVAPSRARPVWLVTSPTRLFRSAANPSARRTSMPLRTGTRAGVGTEPEGPKSRPVSAAPSSPSGSVVREAAATVATRARSGVTSPLPSGCTRFDRKIT